MSPTPSQRRATLRMLEEVDARVRSEFRRIVGRKRRIVVRKYSNVYVTIGRYEVDQQMFRAWERRGLLLRVESTPDGVVYERGEAWL